jgi:hypothetical protein
VRWKKFRQIVFSSRFRDFFLIGESLVGFETEYEFLVVLVAADQGNGGKAIAAIIRFARQYGFLADRRRKKHSNDARRIRTAFAVFGGFSAYYAAGTSQHNFHFDFKVFFFADFP